MIVNDDAQRLIFSLLGYRKDCRGRALSADIPHLGLRKYDRLLPTIQLLDVSNFEKRSVPFSAHFWRMTKQDRVFHDCPFVTVGVPGLTYDKWAVDGLHSWALGGLQGAIGHGLQFCMKSPVFRPLCAHLCSKDIDRLALNHIKTLLMHWYKQRRTDPQWKKNGTEARL